MQQDNRKKIGLFVIIIGLLALIAIIYFGFFKNKTAAPITNPVSTSTTNTLPAGTETNATGTAETPRAIVEHDLSKEAPHKINGTDVAKIGMAFTERFGSYSNQSSYGNFIDLKILMTSNMKDWADNYVADLKASSTAANSYYGITTNALTNEIKKFDDASGVASIIVTTKRQENTESITPSAAYIQKLDLDFKKVNGEWLVDRAYWEK